MNDAATLTDVLVTILEWAARLAVLIVAWMLRMLFNLNTEKKLIKRDLEAEIEARRQDVKNAKEQRAEFLTLVKETNDKVDALRGEQNSAHVELLTAIHQVKK